MILYDSGWSDEAGLWIVSIGGPAEVGGWRNWAWTWVPYGRKRLYRVLGFEIERELPWPPE